MESLIPCTEKAKQTSLHASKQEGVAKCQEVQSYLSLSAFVITIPADSAFAVIGETFNSNIPKYPNREHWKAHEQCSAQSKTSIRKDEMR